MKKKIFLALAIISLLTCLFAISVNAATTNEFGEVEIIAGISEKSVFGADGTADGYTSKVVMFDGTEYHTYPAYYIFTNNVYTTTNFKELNDATGKNYVKTSLIRAEVPQNVQKVTGSIFEAYNDLKYVRFPDTLIEISGNMFYTSHGLEWVNVPRDCVSIGGYAFYGCSSLKTIDMTNAKSLKRTEANQFYNCPNLEELIFPEGFEYFGGAGGCGQTYQNGVGSLKTLYLPDTVTYMGSISEMKSIGTFTVPLGITSLKSNQFSYCTGLNHIVIHKNVTSIDSNAFNMTFYLKEFIYTGNENDSVVNDIKKYVSPNYGAPTITYANHCAYYFNGVHQPAVEIIKFVGQEFLSNANVCSDCPRCSQSVILETVAPLFVCKGWSYSEYDSSIAQSFTIDKMVLPFYQEKLGISKYGIVGAINTYFENGVEKTYSDGSLLTLENGSLICSDKAISADFTNSEYSIFRMKMVGINEENENAKIFICAYVQADENIYYLNNEVASQNVAINSTSIADLKKKDEE